MGPESMANHISPFYLYFFMALKFIKITIYMGTGTHKKQRFMFAKTFLDLSRQQQTPCCWAQSLKQAPCTSTTRDLHRLWRCLKAWPLTSPAWSLCILEVSVVTLPEVPLPHTPPPVWVKPAVPHSSSQWQCLTVCVLREFINARRAALGLLCAPSA